MKIEDEDRISRTTLKAAQGYMNSETPSQETFQFASGNLAVPDRFEALKRISSGELSSIIIPVNDAIRRVREVHRDMKAAGRGSFLLVRGDSGSGKSTFFSTLGLFLEQVTVVPFARETNIHAVLRRAEPSPPGLRVFIMEGRDALRDVPQQELEAAIHEINWFIRSPSGERSLVVWPVNSDDLETKLIQTAKNVGGESLLGVGEPSFRFQGPPRANYLEIARRTIATLNQGAHIADLGVSNERAQKLADESGTIGHFLGLLRRDLLQNQSEVDTLLAKEKCRLWVVVCAGNDPDGDIAGLTRGALSAIDIERLMSATNANIIQELKRYPNKLGILGSVLDAKILHLPIVTALAVARAFAGKKLQAEMEARSLSIARPQDAGTRLAQSELGARI